MEAFSRNKSNILIFTAFLAVSAVSIWGALIDRPLWSDGVVWLYSIINRKEFFYDPAFSRYLSIVPQLPVWIYVNFFPDFDITTAKQLFTMGYGLINLFWLGLSVAYLLHKKRRDLLIVQFFIFLGPIFSEQGFYVSTVGETIGLGTLVFWILYLEESKKRVLLTFGVGSILIFGSYEFGVLYWGVYALLFYRKGNRKLAVTSAVLCVFGLTYFFFWQGRASNIHIHSTFIPSLLSVPEGLNALSLFLIASFPLLYLPKKRFLNALWILVFAIFIVIGVRGLSSFNLHEHSTNFYNARTTAILKACAVLGTFLIARRKDIQNEWPAYGLMGLMLGFVICHEVLFNGFWKEGIDKLEKRVLSSKGCQFITKEEYKEYKAHEILEWVLPYHSLVTGGKRRAEVILFTPRGDQWENINPCFDRIDNRSFNFAGPFLMTVDPGTFELDQLMN